MDNGLRLMHVHAHPDDEASKGAASTAKYVAEGVRVKVVTCTGGERGDVLNPTLTVDPERMAELRREEMASAVAILASNMRGWDSRTRDSRRVTRRRHCPRAALRPSTSRRRLPRWSSRSSSSVRTS